IAGTDVFYRATLTLHPPEAGGDDQRLAERMGMPCGARARLKGDVCALHPVGIGGVEQCVDAHASGEPFGGTGAGRCLPGTIDLHGYLLWFQSVSMRSMC